MAHRNRVDPFGNLLAVDARGALTGNRGILHDGQKRIVRTHANQNWVACVLAFKGRSRTIMAPGNYTELFFLDEVTAFAAGHRPCGECRRARYADFTQVWRQVHGEPEPGRSLPRTIDRILHAHRITRGGRKVTWQAEARTLPSGTVFAQGDRAVLVWGQRQFDWHPDGYTTRETPVAGAVGVLTPRPVVDLFHAGFLPAVHGSVPVRNPVGMVWDIPEEK